MNQNFVNNLLTVLLVLVTGVGVYLFSAVAFVGLVMTVLPDQINRFGSVVSTFTTFAILVSILLIILIPLIQIIRNSNGKRWKIARSALLLLWPYFITSYILIRFANYIVTKFGWVSDVGSNNPPQLFFSGITVSVILIVIYFWYIKKIKTLLLKK